MTPDWTFLGVRHQDTDLDARGRLALDARAGDVYGRLMPYAQEVLVLSTCNRSEIYAFGDVEALAPLLRGAFADATRATDAEIARSAYRLDGAEVPRHLFLVAAGLEAQLVGETQILGQIRAAYAQAAEAGAAHRELATLVQAALHTARRAHAETGLDEHPVSVGSAAVALARRELGDLSDRTVLLLGAGEVAELCCRHLRAAGAAHIAILNRTRERAAALAAEIGGVAAGWEELPGWLRRADLVLSSTGAPHAVLFARDIRDAQRARAGRRLLLIDLAVPRDVEPASASVAGVRLLDLDDLGAVSLAQRQARLRSAEAARAVALAGAEEFERQRRERRALPLILSLRGRAEEVREAEVQRALRRLGDVPPAERQVIEQLAARIVNKLLNDPTVALKAAAQRDDAAEALRLAASLLRLPEQAGPQEA